MIEYEVVKPGIEPKVNDVIILETGQEALIICLDAGHMSLQPGVFDKEPIGKMYRNHIIPLKPCMECGHGGGITRDIPPSLMTCSVKKGDTKWYETCDDFRPPMRNYHVQKVEYTGPVLKSAVRKTPALNAKDSRIEKALELGSNNDFCPGELESGTCTAKGGTKCSYCLAFWIKNGSVPG